LLEAARKISSNSREVWKVCALEHDAALTHVLLGRSRMICLSALSGTGVVKEYADGK
jgi:hypothetical protein